MMRLKGAFNQTIQGLKNVPALAFMSDLTTMLNAHRIPDTLDFWRISACPLSADALSIRGRA
jgi:hypothetical protein